MYALCLFLKCLMCFKSMHATSIFQLHYVHKLTLLCSSTYIHTYVYIRIRTFYLYACCDWAHRLSFVIVRIFATLLYICDY